MITNCIIADPKRSANLDFSIILDISIKLILNTILPNVIGIIVSGRIIDESALIKQTVGRDGIQFDGSLIDQTIAINNTLMCC